MKYNIPPAVTYVTSALILSGKSKRILNARPPKCASAQRNSHDEDPGPLTKMSTESFVWLILPWIKITLHTRIKRLFSLWWKKTNSCCRTMPFNQIQHSFHVVVTTAPLQVCSKLNIHIFRPAILLRTLNQVQLNHQWISMGYLPQWNRPQQGIMLPLHHQAKYLMKLIHKR